MWINVRVRVTGNNKHSLFLKYSMVRSTKIKQKGEEVKTA